MKNYILKTLQDAAFIWLTLEVEVIFCSALYAILVTVGMSKSTSLLVAFLILVVGIVTTDPTIRFLSSFLNLKISVNKSLNEIEASQRARDLYEEVAVTHERDLDSNEPSASSETSFAITSLKRYEHALVAYEHALRLNPDDASAYYRRGVVLDKLGRTTAAQITYDETKQLEG